MAPSVAVALFASFLATSVRVLCARRTLSQDHSEFGGGSAASADEEGEWLAWAPVLELSRSGARKPLHILERLGASGVAWRLAGGDGHGEDDGDDRHDQDVWLMHVGVAANGGYDVGAMLRCPASGDGPCRPLPAAAAAWLRSAVAALRLNASASCRGSLDPFGRHRRRTAPAAAASLLEVDGDGLAFSAESSLEGGDMKIPDARVAHEMKSVSTSLIDLNGGDAALADDGVPGREECAICLEDISLPCRLGCGHQFCHECIGAWFQRSGVCPMCRHTARPGVGAEATRAYWAVQRGWRVRKIRATMLTSIVFVGVGGVCAASAQPGERHLINTGFDLAILGIALAITSMEAAYDA